MTENCGNQIAENQDDAVESETNNKLLDESANGTSDTLNEDAEIDPFLIEQLRNPRNRQALYRLEASITEFVRNYWASRLSFNSLNAQQRLIVHRLADYFGLHHVVTDGGAEQQSNGGGGSFFAPLVAPNAAAAAAAGFQPIPPALRTVVLTKSAETHIPKAKLESFVPKEEEQPQVFKIMKRSDASPTAQGAPVKSSTAGPSPARTTKQTAEHQMSSDQQAADASSKTFEERESEYALARMRILGDQLQPDAVQPLTTMPLPLPLPLPHVADAGVQNEAEDFGPRARQKFQQQLHRSQPYNQPHTVPYPPQYSPQPMHYPPIPYAPPMQYYVPTAPVCTTPYVQPALGFYPPPHPHPVYSPYQQSGPYLPANPAVATQTVQARPVESPPLLDDQSFPPISALASKQVPKQAPKAASPKQTKKPTFKKAELTSEVAKTDEEEKQSTPADQKLVSVVKEGEPDNKPRLSYAQMANKSEAKATPNTQNKVLPQKPKKPIAKGAQQQTLVGAAAKNQQSQTKKTTSQK
eukprot:TRINITY_DN7853_c0_g1_i1.p1 TRINITY_DN7853_c0_g1~~TRINITY_DN7853_c0_g1_i1.p1  ORF type:complete len:525 (-),score=84.18 TRINITY_DN7853_c0_g1_i1:62-1636(-)